MRHGSGLQNPAKKITGANLLRILLERQGIDTLPGIPRRRDPSLPRHAARQRHPAPPHRHRRRAPLVAIIGQIPQALIGTDAFQEVDTYGLTLPITKYNSLVYDAAKLFEIVPLAFQRTESGHPGPVAIDVPKARAKRPIEIAALPSPVTPERPRACKARRQTCTATPRTKVTQ